MGQVLAIVGLQIVGLTALMTLRWRQRRRTDAPVDVDLESRHGKLDASPRQ